VDVQQIKGMGRKLRRFLDEFSDCFGRSEPREHLRTYVQGFRGGLGRLRPRDSTPLTPS